MAAAAESVLVQSAESGAPPLEAGARLKALAVEHFQFVWRSLRRLGVEPSLVDDAAQQVFEVAARKLACIEVGCEQAFLFQTAVRVASGTRRRIMTRREVIDDDLLAEQRHPQVGPEEAAEIRECRAFLDDVLDAMPLSLRTTFVLFELEELPIAQIAIVLDIPQGTVSSRLRRAREVFHAETKRLRALLASRRGAR